MEPMERSSRVHAAAGGVVAGLIGGAGLAAVMVVTALAKHQDIWPVLTSAGAPFLHERATQPGFELVAVLTGLLGNMAVSVGWGVLFALLFYGLGRPATVMVGAAWGVVVWLVMYHVVLPLLGLGAIARSVPASSAIVEHILYGLGVGLGFLPFQRSQPLAELPLQHMPVLDGPAERRRKAPPWHPRTCVASGHVDASARGGSLPPWRQQPTSRRS